MIIRIRDKDRDLITGISEIKDYRGGIGFVVFDFIVLYFGRKKIFSFGGR